MTEYWIADAERGTVRVHRRVDGRLTALVQLASRAGDEPTSPLLPGLTVRLGDVFGPKR